MPNVQAMMADGRREQIRDARFCLHFALRKEKSGSCHAGARIRLWLGISHAIRISVTHQQHQLLGKTAPLSRLEYRLPLVAGTALGHCACVPSGSVRPAEGVSGNPNSPSGAAAPNT